MLKVIEIKHLKNYTFWLHFDDGTEGTVDLYQHLQGPMFEPLKDIKLFKQGYLDPELETIAWPNGVDIAPEFLKAHLD